MKNHGKIDVDLHENINDKRKKKTILTNLGVILAGTHKRKSSVEALKCLHALHSFTNKLQHGVGRPGKAYKPHQEKLNWTLKLTKSIMQCTMNEALEMQRQWPYMYVLRDE